MSATGGGQRDFHLQYDSGAKEIVPQAGIPQEEV